MQTIRAAVCREIGAPLTIETVHLADPGPGQVGVRIEAVAICHSDVTYIDGGWEIALPAVFGHEAVGIVETLGPGVRRLAVGDRVLVTLLRACGVCAACAGGAPAYCVEKGMPRQSPLHSATGETVTQAMSCAAFAEKVTVDASQCAAVPQTIPAAAASVLSCGVVTGVGAAVNTARIRPGQTVVVIGCGGVGLNAIQGARLAGAARIVAMDMTEEKLAAAREFGATDGILATEPKPWAALRAIAPGLADAVLVTVGAIPAYEQALRLIGPRGQVVLIGMPHSGAKAEYEPVILAATGQALVGSLMGDTVLARDIPWMVDLYGQGRLQLDNLVSGTWRLDQINEAIASTKSGAARRNVIVF